MATCIETITGNIQDGSWLAWPALTPSIPTNVSATTSTKTIVYLATNKSESIVFSVIINTPAGRPYTLSIFKIVNGGASLVSMGALNGIDQAVTFQKDFSPGEYALCFGSSQSVEGTISAQFAGFISEIRLFPKAAHGSSGTATLTVTQGSFDTRLRRIYTLVDGELPPGFVLQKDGSIRGQIDNLDAVTESEYAPSINWFFSDQDNRWISAPRRWKFKARVELIDHPEAWDEEWFTIDIHNNWNKDKAAFEKDGPGFDVIVSKVEYIDVPNPVAEYSACCPNSQEIVPISKVSLQPIPVPAALVTADPLTQIVSEFENDGNFNIREFVKRLKKTDKYTQTHNTQTFEEVTMLQNARQADHSDAAVLSINNEHKSTHMPLLLMAHSGETLMSTTLS